MTSREFQDRLSRRARKAGVAVDTSTSRRLEVYFSLLTSWNRKINLTALDLEIAPDEAIDRLLVEPLAALRYVRPLQGTLIDIGSGSGSPAVPIAVAVPGLKLVMVESKARKSAFLRELVRQVGLQGAEVETARFEELLTRPGLHEAADFISVRAVRLEQRILMTLQAFLKPGGQLLLFRGPSGLDVPASVTPPLAWRSTHPLLESTRGRLVIIGKAESPGRVPRGTTP